MGVVVKIERELKKKKKKKEGSLRALGSERKKMAGHQWLMLAILATQEAENRRIMV
jgi:hypothetical protein